MPHDFPKPPPYDHDHESEVTLFAKTNYRNQMRTFGIKTDDRRRHTYVIGKTGMGKSVLLENFALADIYAGHGLAFIDPHGDTAQRLLDFIPEHRIKDVVYFNPADTAYPVGFNIFETVGPDQKHLVANGLMGVFKKIWPDVWSARMEYILQNSILVLLDAPGSTFLGINRLFVDEEFRARTVGVCQDPLVKTFWLKEFAAFTEKYRTEAVAPVQNKVGQFLSASIIRNIVAQQKSTINIREIMDTRKIFIVNLSKGLVGEENSRLLGAMIITRLQLAAMERVDIPNEDDRQDFYLYVDEFQNFATESFASILSEARKYRLNLIVAHQYIEQLDEMVRAAIFGNVGTIISFRVGAADAMFMENEFAPTFLPEDLVNLTKYTIYLKLMINGAASEPFSASTLPPIAKVTGSRDAVIQSSRMQYAMERSLIEKMVIRWSGYGTGDTGAKIESEEEIEERKEKDADEALLDEIEAKNKEEMARLAKTSPDVGEAVTPPPAFGQKKKKEAKYEIPCSVCGEPQKLTFEPDYSKPWYCKDHLDQKEKDAAKRFSKPAGAPPRRNALPPRADDRLPRRDDRPPRRDDRPRNDDRPPRRDERPPRRDDRPRNDARPPRPSLPPLGTGSVRILTGDQDEADEVPLSELLGGGKTSAPDSGEKTHDRPERRTDSKTREGGGSPSARPKDGPSDRRQQDDDDEFPKSDGTPARPSVVFKSSTPTPSAPASTRDASDARRREDVTPKPDASAAAASRSNPEPKGGGVSSAAAPTSDTRHDDAAAKPESSVQAPAPRPAIEEENANLSSAPRALESERGEPRPQTAPTARTATAIGSGRTIHLTGGASAADRGEEGDRDQGKKRKRRRKKKEREGEGMPATGAERPDSTERSERPMPPVSSETPARNDRRDDASPTPRPKNNDGAAAAPRPAASAPPPAPETQNDGGSMTVPPPTAPSSRPAPETGSEGTSRPTASDAPAPRSVSNAKREEAPRPTPLDAPSSRPAPDTKSEEASRPSPQPPKERDAGGDTGSSGSRPSDSDASDSGSSPLKPGQVIRF